MQHKHCRQALGFQSSHSRLCMHVIVELSVDKLMVLHLQARRRAGFVR